MAIQITPHFALSEFACREKVAEDQWIIHPVPQGLIPNLWELCERLEIVREKVGQPIHVLSGWRSEEVNRRCGGARLSQHLKAKAADIYVDGLPAAELHGIVLGLIRDGTLRDGGVGFYPANANRAGWVHYDIGPVRRWRG